MSDTPTTPAPRYLPYLNDAATILNLACAPGTDPSAVAANVMRVRSLLASVEYTIAEARPYLTVAEVRRDYHNDPETLAEVRAWRDTYTFADVTDLAGTGDGDTWTIVAGDSSRYVVRALPRYTPSGDGMADIVDDTHIPQDQYTAEVADGTVDPDETVYLVWDTSTDEPADRSRRGTLADVGHEDYDVSDEDEATSAAEAANVRDYEESACGWPFAHNYAAKIEEYDTERFAAAGFVVARYRGGDLYAGIDGGGYDFIEAHWLPVFLAAQVAHDGRGFVRTSGGVRVVTAG